MLYIKLIFPVVLSAFISCGSLRAQDAALTNGTIIITLISNDTIWMGADSRTSALTDTGYRVNKKGMCKIYSTNDIVYAMAGHVRYVDNSFDFLKMMQKCITEHKDFEQSMQKFEETATAEIESILTKFSRRSINTLIKTNSGSFLTVVAVSFVNGEKKTKQMRFSVAAVADDHWKVNLKSTEENGTGTLRFFGHAANASAFVRDNKLYFGNGRNIPGKINELIELEAAKGTVTVGLPADVISIYDGGVKWAINSGLCR